MYLNGEIDSKNNIKEALKYFTEGSLKGENKCFAEMGKIYLDMYSDNYNLNNGLKCWKKYFNNIDIQYITTEDIIYFARYLYLIRVNNLPLEEKEILSFSKERIINELISTLDISKGDNYDIMSRIIKEEIDYINTNLKEPEDTIYAEYLNKSNAIISEGIVGISDNTLIYCKVVNGYIHGGDNIIVSNKYGKISSKILSIYHLQKMTPLAGPGMNIGVLLEGNASEFNFINLEGGSLTSID